MRESLRVKQQGQVSIFHWCKGSSCVCGRKPCTAKCLKECPKHHSVLFVSKQGTKIKVTRNCA